MIDYHIHTILCNHAKDSMERYIKKAISFGLKELCFLDHLTIERDTNELSMELEEIALYFYAVKRLKQKYKNYITIKIGLEIDFNPKHIDLINDIINRFSFDAIGSSVHFIDDFNLVSKRFVNRYETVDIDELYDQYFKQIELMLEYEYFDFVCHLDAIKKFGYYPKYSFDEQIENILEKIKQKNLSLEFNLNGLNHPIKEYYPSLKILQKCKEFNINIVLGSDSHKSETIGNYYDDAIKTLRELGYKKISVFNKRKSNFYEF